MRAKQSLVGRRIADVRAMTPEEMDREGWDGDPPAVLVLDDGTTLYASRDEEGNGPGALFGAAGPRSFVVLIPQ